MTSELASGHFRLVQVPPGTAFRRALTAPFQQAQDLAIRYRACTLQQLSLVPSVES